MDMYGNVHATFVVLSLKKERLSCNGLSQVMKHGCTGSEPASKFQSMELKYTSLPRNKKFKSMPSANKMMLFWDLSGSILQHCQDSGWTVNSAWLYAILEEELKLAIHSRCRGMLTNGIILHHNNAETQMAATSVETV
jgi:hypothetical protein